MIVNITFQVADSILALAYLGFLGFGLTIPTSRGATCSATRRHYVESGYWWLVYPVGAASCSSCSPRNLVGDALRDAFDVRLRRR